MSNPSAFELFCTERRLIETRCWTVKKTKCKLFPLLMHLLKYVCFKCASTLDALLLLSSYGKVAVLEYEMVWWFIMRLWCILISTNNNNNTQRKLDYTSFTLLCICSWGGENMACDCLCISSKYEESREKILIISHESCPCVCVYSVRMSMS